MRKALLKIVFPVFALVLVFLAVASILPVQAYASVSASEDESDVRVFVGDLENAPGSYAAERMAYLDQLAKTRASGTVEAIIGFDDYYDLDEVMGWVEQYDLTVKYIYWWPAGETGRLGLFVQNGDVPKAIADFAEEVERRGEDDGLWEYNQRFFNGERGVFALTVFAPAGTLDEMAADLGCVSYVDVKYNEDVERYAAQKGKEVSYIELPSKPDGAL